MYSVRIYILELIFAAIKFCEFERKGLLPFNFVNLASQEAQTGQIKK